MGERGGNNITGALQRCKVQGSIGSEAEFTWETECECQRNFLQEVTFELGQKE